MRYVPRVRRGSVGHVQAEIRRRGRAALIRRAQAQREVLIREDPDRSAADRQRGGIEQQPPGQGRRVLHRERIRETVTVADIVVLERAGWQPE